ncbi:MAG: ribonuclease D [Gammaproteobacteria bacterium]
MSDSYSRAPEWITSDDHLRDWCARADGGRILAIDTEFERQRTYFAELCLIQVASSDAIACIDTLALDGLDALRALFAAPQTTRILHAARQDLEVLHHAGAPLAAPLLDTQIAAALGGFNDQIGYADLVYELLGIALDKSQTRTDWRRRPLSAAQLSYAADDVRHLPAVAASLCQRLEQLGRLPWLEEDCRNLNAVEVIDPPASEAWQRVKGLQGLPPAAFARARTLATWREGEARARDLPRGWVLKDSELLVVALRAPHDVRALGRVLEGNPAFVRRHGDALLEVLENAPDETTAMPQSAGPPTPAQRERAKTCAGHLKARAAELGLQPAVLLTRREIEAIVSGRLPPRLREGWRAQVLDGLLDEFLAPAAA